MYILRITAVWCRTLPYHFVLEIPGTFYCNMLLLFQEILSILLSTQNYSCHVIESGHTLWSSYTTQSRPLRLSLINDSLCNYRIFHYISLKCKNFKSKPKMHLYGAYKIQFSRPKRLNCNDTFTWTHYPLKCHLMLWSMKSIKSNKRQKPFLRHSRPCISRPRPVS